MIEFVNMSIIQVLKDIGSIVGLAAGLFIIFDRFLLYRPIVTFVRTQTNIGVCVKNVSSESIFITDIANEPPDLKLAFGDNDGCTIEAAAKAIKLDGEKPPPVAFLLEPGKERYMNCTSPGGDFEADAEFWVYWRFCRNRWLPHFPVRLHLSREMQKKLMAARMSPP